MHEKKAKIVSLVPSWTETLLEAGVSVAGRTQFCIHPAELIRGIPAVGGTKNLRIDEIIALKPDFVILDKEENNAAMADALWAAKIETLVSHVSGIDSAAEFLEILAVQTGNSVLNEYALRYRNLPKLSQKKFLDIVLLDQNCEPDFGCYDYVIWKNPFMVIGQDTFIADVFKRVGLDLHRPAKYPKIDPNELQKSFCLFSTEPYPFAKDFESLTREGFRGALIDGEKISWYGIRNLKFLELCAE